MLCFEDRESMLCRRVTEHFTSDWDTNMEFPVTDRIPSALLVLTHRDRTDTIYRYRGMMTNRYRIEYLKNFA